ncbi:MAG: sulfite exporter TauE/SafE family protein [Ignavibacteriae bacterium]|nr:sulfite exporter TauE/SafE family protein [Ignavibacteria bacterium]MBI3364094.1 sulfite exporter TauE/SafE family protein [Ignavibacteriota bacterium]
MVQVIQFIVLGLFAGVLAGILGIGGAVFVVPVLVYVFGWEQHLAQGTTLAMLVPPIGILAAWQYYQAGHVDLKVAGLLCIGFFVGGYFGGFFANQLPAATLRKIFGVALFLISLKLIVGK